MGGRQQWTEGRLGNYAYIKARIGWRGLSADEYTYDGPYLIAGNHIHNGQINWSLCDHISNYRYQESWEIALEEKDVILTKDGTIGRVAFVNRLPGSATINGTMMLVRARPPLVPKFVYHYLTGERFQKLVTEKVSGSSIPHIFQRDLVELSIPILPEEEQQRIAEILDTADAAIRQAEAHIAKLKQIKAGMLHDLLTRGIDAESCLRDPVAHPGQFKDSSLGKIPREWQIKPLEEVAQIGTGLTLGRNISGPKTIELPYLRVANVQDGYLDLSDVKTVQVYQDEVQRFLLQPGDVLMNEGGDFDKLGRGTVWSGEISPCLHQNHVFRVRTNRQQLLPEFLAVISASSYGKRFFVLSSKQSTNLASINSTQLKAFPILCPSVTEQQKIVDTIKINDALIESKETRLAKLRQVKQGLMHDLLTGRIPV